MENMNEKYENENVNETTETVDDTQTNEEKAEVSGNIFKKIIGVSAAGAAVVIGFIKKLFNRNSDDETGSPDGENNEKKPGFFARMGGKIKNFFSSKVNFAAGENEIRNSGISAILAIRCSRFINKMIKKFTKRKKDDDECESTLASIIHVVIKVVAVMASVVFAGAVLYYFVQLLPAILAAIAKCMAICAIVELVFLVLGSTTGEYVDAKF